MKKIFQIIILTSYQFVKGSGILSTSWGRYLSDQAYYFYKRFFEHSIDHLRYFVHPGTTVLDVGANIGFFTVTFSKWVANGGYVIAIEPESCNVDALRRSIARNRSENVEIIQAAAAEKDGDLFLSLNLSNPADHRLSEAGVPIKGVSIDSLMSERGWPLVSLIKIDIQGAEPRALAGAQETISRFHPAIFMEVDDDALAAGGFSANELIDSLRNIGYQMYTSKRGVLDGPLRNEDGKKIRKNLGYADFIFLYK